MNGKTPAAILAVILIAPSLALAATVSIEVRANPESMTGGSSSTIGIRVTGDGTPLGDRALKIGVVDGPACGKLELYDLRTSPDGTASVRFIGDSYVKNCFATIKVTSSPTQTDSGAEASTKVTVTPESGAVGKIDGVGAIAFVLIVSFAIDRLIRALFFLLSYSQAWARRFPDPELSDAQPSAKAQRNRRLLYVFLAGLLGMVTLAWFGHIRLLASLGFPGVNPLLDILVTGLILVGGADRTEQILKSLGGGAGPSAHHEESKPLEITGRLIIDDHSKSAVSEKK